MIVIASANEAVKWFGLIESKVKYLISNLEQEPSVHLARIWPKPLIRRADKSQAWTQLWFIGVTFAKEEPINIPG